MKLSHLFAMLGCSAALISIGCQGSNEEPAPTEPSTSTAESTAPPATDDGAASAATVSYSSVQELFDANCIGCHGAKNPPEDLNLTSYESVMKGGEHGPVVVAGEPENSRLVQALEGSHGIERMPKGGDPLAEDKIAQVKSWIEQGAPSE